MYHSKSCKLANTPEKLLTYYMFLIHQDTILQNLSNAALTVVLISRLPVSYHNSTVKHFSKYTSDHGSTLVSSSWTTYCIDLTGQVFSNTGFSYINRYRMLLSQKKVFLQSTGFGMVHFGEILFCDCSCVPSSRIIASCIIMSMHYPKSMQELTRRKNWVQSRYRSKSVESNKLHFSVQPSTIRYRHFI